MYDHTLYDIKAGSKKTTVKILGSWCDKVLVAFLGQKLPEDYGKNFLVNQNVRKFDHYV